MSVIIDNESGKIVADFDKPKKPKAPKVPRVKKSKRPRVPASIAPAARDDLAVALGAVQQIFDTADHIARIIGGKR